MTLSPAQEWWTPAQIAESGLPDLPKTRQGVDALADRLKWRQTKFARRRAGKGGGWEYSWKLFPNAAQRALIKQAVAPKAAEAKARDEVWAWYEALPQAVKAKAEARLLMIQKVEALEPAIGRFLAVAQVAQMEEVGARTIWSWLAMIEGVAAHDRLAYLAPRNRAAEKRPRAKECSPEFFDLLKSDYLRLGEPPFTDCYRRATRIARDKGLDILPERTMRRHLDAAVSRPSQVLARRGVDAVKRLFPAQVRDKTCLHAMEAVNADFHKFDVFVRWPSVGGQPGLVTRPQMVAFQDIHSGRILSWRVDQTPNSTAVMLCAGDMIEAWGIPERVLFDNGREFAAKVITGGAATRFRFKVKEDDIQGLFVQLGCTIHWATPYSGQSKTIERAWRDMCSSISKDPRFDGAYTGNRPDAKPENYGSKAIDLEYFLKVVAEGIDEHNAREDRSSEVASGRSFNAVFDESYASAPIRKATEAQRRLWLLGAEGLRADRKTGEIWFMDNQFWDPWMSDIAGQRVVVRFDPTEFHAGLHIYSQDGAYLGHAQVREAKGFFDMEEARILSRAKSTWLKAQKAEVEAHRRFKAADLGQMLDGLAAPSLVVPEAKVVKPVFGKPGKPDAAARAAQPAEIATLAAHRPAPPAVDGPRALFRRALDLERQIAAGEPVTVEHGALAARLPDTPRLCRRAGPLGRLGRRDFWMRQEKNMAEKRKLPPNLAALSNVSKLLSLVETLEGRGSALDGMGAFYGRPGLGKTSSGTCCAVLRQTVHLSINPFIREKGLMQMIATELGARVPARITKDDLFNLTCAAIAEAKRTIILDEADHLMRETVINTVRFLHDETRIPIILMGEEDLPVKLLQFPRVYGRILERFGAEEATMADLELLIAVEAKGFEIAQDLREELLTGSGYTHRYIVKNIDAIRRMALAQGLSRVTRADWGSRLFDKGDIQNPRVLPEYRRQPQRVRRVA